MLRVVLLVLPGLLSAQLDRTISLYCPSQSLGSSVHTSFKNVLYSVSGEWGGGELQWKFEAPGRIAAHVTADWYDARPNGLVYVTAYSSMDDKERPSPMLFALDAGNGTEKWKMELPSGDCDGLCLPRDALFATFDGDALVQVFGDWYRRNATLLSIDMAGKIQWKFMTNGDPIQHFSVGFGDELLVGGLKEGSLHLLDAYHGFMTVKWTMDFSGGIVRTPGPNARYMDESGTVVALASSSDRGPSYPQVSYILVIDRDGTIRSNISTTLSFACASNFKNPVGKNRSIYVNGVNAGDHDPCALRAFSYDGEVLMTRPGMVYDEWLAPNTYQWSAEITHSGTPDKGDILYTGSSHTKPHTSGDMINTITALNGADGSVLWKANLSDSTMHRGMNHQVVAFDRGYESSDDILLVWNDWTTGDLSANKVYAIHTGKEVWSLTTGDMLPPVVDQCSASSSTLITYIASSTCHRCGKLGSNPSLKLFALDQKGTVIWTFAPKPNETLIV